MYQNVVKYGALDERQVTFETDLAVLVSRETRLVTHTFNTHIVWVQNTHFVHAFAVFNSIFLVYTCTYRTFNWVAIARMSPGYLRCR